MSVQRYARCVFFAFNLALLLPNGYTCSRAAAVKAAFPPSGELVDQSASETSVSAKLTKEDLEAFFDALLPSQLENRDVAGAVIAVIKDNNVLFARGYGYADFAAKKRVVAEQTLFRLGSISKVFTATAVMQLVEQGKLDLDRDVSNYLDFPIPKTYPEPITLRHLLTHTSGFEDVAKYLFAPSADEMRPLRDYLIAAMPQRIFRPGTIPSYSNYGFALAGYIVERASGQSLEDYISAHITLRDRWRQAGLARSGTPSL